MGDDIVEGFLDNAIQVSRDRWFELFRPTGRLDGTGERAALPRAFGQFFERGQQPGLQQARRWTAAASGRGKNSDSK
jgi:hypothetical protein